MDSDTRDVLDDAAQAGPDGYEIAADAELGQLVAESVARTGPLDPDAVTFGDEVDYDDCAIGACAPPTVMTKGKRPEMTFWEAHKLITNARSHGLPLKVTARTCTLLDRALRAAKEHSRRTQHAMMASYHYETLPGPIGDTEVRVVDDIKDANVRVSNIRAVGDSGWKFLASTITADVATIRANVTRNFRDDGDGDLPSDGCTSTGDRLVDELAKDRPDADARVLRVLAARIARAGTSNEDPLLTLVDVAAVLKSLTAAVAALAGQSLSDVDAQETFTTYATTIDHLHAAADGVAEMAGWF